MHKDRSPRKAEPLLSGADFHCLFLFFDRLFLRFHFCSGHFLNRRHSARRFSLNDWLRDKKVSKPERTGIIKKRIPLGIRPVELDLLMVLSVCVDLKHTVNLFTKHHAGQLMRKSHGGKRQTQLCGLFHTR